MSEVDVREEIRRAILVGDYWKADQLASQVAAAGEISRAQAVQIQMAIEAIKWGQFEPARKEKAELLALAMKL